MVFSLLELCLFKAVSREWFCLSHVTNGGIVWCNTGEVYSCLTGTFTCQTRHKVRTVAYFYITVVKGHADKCPLLWRDKNSVTYLLQRQIKTWLEHKVLLNKFIVPCFLYNEFKKSFFTVDFNSRVLKRFNSWSQPMEDHVFSCLVWQTTLHYINALAFLTPTDAGRH